MKYYETEKEARVGGDAVMRRMKSTGWELEVWENLGWHWALIQGPISLTELRRRDAPPTYSCLLSDKINPEHHGGSMIWSDHEHFEDPNMAVLHQVELARKAVDNLVAVVERVEEI